MEDGKSGVQRWKLNWRAEMLRKASKMADVLLRSPEIDKAEFGTFLSACLEARVITAQDLISELGIDKSAPTRWSQDNGSAPTKPVRTLVVQLIHDAANRKVEELDNELRSLEDAEGRSR